MKYLSSLKTKLAVVVLTFLWKVPLFQLIKCNLGKTFKFYPSGGIFVGDALGSSCLEQGIGLDGLNGTFRFYDSISRRTISALGQIVTHLDSKGLLSQNSNYMLTVPASISVRQGLWVHVPCQFTFPPQASSEILYGYWFKKESHGYPPRSQPGHLVATNDKKAAIDKSAKNRFQLTKNPNRGNCSFSINNAQWNDEGQYYFRIEQGSLKYTYVNHSDRIHTSPFIFVLGSPQVVKILTNVTNQGHTALCAQEAKGDLDSAVAQEGESIMLQCIAEGRPLPTLSWIKGNKSISGSQQGKENRLLLLEVRPEDAGEYQCRAESPYGSAKKTLQLCVQYAPRLSSSSQATSTCRREDNDLFCTCSLHSWPPPQIQWQMDGETINMSIPKQAVGATFQAHGNELTSTLTWTGKLNEDHDITCFAINPSGAYTLQFVLGLSITRTHPDVLISAFCGPLITASFFLLGMCLTRLLKRRKVSSHSKGQQVAEDVSEIYSNISPREGVQSCAIQHPLSRYSGIYNNLQLPESITYSSVLPE